MVRMSDILKRAKGKEEEEKKALEPSQPEEAKAKPEEPKASGVQISPIVMKESKGASYEDCVKLYEETVGIIKELLKKDMKYKSFDIKRVTAQVEKMVDQLILENENILALAFDNPLQTVKDFLPFHLVDVSIYSIEVGLGIGYEKKELIDLGTSSILHDIGMVKYMDLANLPRKLTADEYNKIKNHPQDGMEILKEIVSLNKTVIEAAYQEHERINGLGYPRGLKGASINEYAKIIGIVDVYVAMIHPRPYRDEYLPLEVVREILNQKGAFENRIVKLLIERLGVFPVGSFVELNTKEMAQVIKVNRKYPLRPVVKVMYDNKGKKLKEPNLLNLGSQCNIYTMRCVAIEKEIKTKEREALG